MTIIGQRILHYLNVIKTCRKPNGKKSFQFFGNLPNTARAYDIYVI